jgi:hypothetical protein
MTVNLERFDKEFDALASLFKKEGFFKDPNIIETDLFVKFLDYSFQVKIITSRLESEIRRYISLQKSFFNCFVDGKEPTPTMTEQMVTTFNEVDLDLSDFYIHTRIFLDTLNTCIKYSFKSAGNLKWKTMKNSIKGLLSKKTMEKYKREIDSNFFRGLEDKVSWILELKSSRDRLLHEFHHFAYTDTKEGEMGFDLIGKIGRTWGTETVKPILKESQGFIDYVSDLMNYLHENLPRTRVEMYTEK